MAGLKLFKPKHYSANRTTTSLAGPEVMAFRANGNFADRDLGKSNVTEPKVFSYQQPFADSMTTMKRLFATMIGVKIIWSTGHI